MAALHALPPATAAVRSPHERMLRRFAGPARAAVRRVYDVEVVGEQHFPASGPVVVAANHTGFADGPLMAIFAPRPLHALTKVEMFKGPMGTFLDHSGQIPLTRETTDVGAVRLAVRVLRDGGTVGIFPEGTRGSGEVLQAHGGAAYLALVTGAPVLPLVFLGTRLPGSAATFPPRGTSIVMEYAAPLRLGRSAWPRRRAEVAAATEVVRQALVDLREQALARTGRPAPGPIPPSTAPSTPEHPPKEPDV